VRLDVGGVPGRVLYRNAQLKTKIKGVWAYGGLGTGTPDIVGFTSVIVTPAMVGQKFARMVGLELKNPDGSGRASDEQKMCIAMWQAHGAIALISKDLEEIKEAFNRAEKGIL
jgi:hypothetical protein